jgi:hypothetical protein
MYFDCSKILEDELRDWSENGGKATVVIGIDGQSPLKDKKKCIEIVTLKIANVGSVADAHSPERCRLLAVLKEPESVRLFEQDGPLSPIGDFASQLISDGKITIGDRSIEVDVRFSVDFVAACYLLGFQHLEKANYCCIWCSCDSKNKSKSELLPERTTTDLQGLYQNLDPNTQVQGRNNQGIERKSILRLPTGRFLFEFVAPEPLHVLINVSRKLLEVELKCVGKNNSDDGLRVELLEFFKSLGVSVEISKFFDHLIFLFLLLNRGGP